MQTNWPMIIFLIVCNLGELYVKFAVWGLKTSFDVKSVVNHDIY